MKKQEECPLEACVREYFGLPESITENDKIDADFGDLGNLLAYYHNKLVDELGQADKSNGKLLRQLEATREHNREVVKRLDERTRELEELLKEVVKVELEAWEVKAAAVNWHNYENGRAGENDMPYPSKPTWLDAAIAAISTVEQQPQP